MSVKWENFRPRVLQVQDQAGTSKVNLTGKSCGGSCIGGNCKVRPRPITKK